MKILRTLIASMVLVALAGSMSAFADPIAFDALGHVEAIPANIGGPFAAYAFLEDNSPDNPLPLTFGTQEHTVVIEGTLVSRMAAGPIMIEEYDVTVTIYTDVGPVSIHDWVTTSSFSEDAAASPSDAILIGTARIRRTDWANNTASYGLAPGFSLNWTSGSRIGELGGSTTNWVLGGGALECPCSDDPITSQDPDDGGHFEVWDLLILEPLVGVEGQSWGTVKELYK